MFFEFVILFFVIGSLSAVPPERSSYGMFTNSTDLSDEDLLMAVERSEQRNDLTRPRRNHRLISSRVYPPEDRNGAPGANRPRPPSADMFESSDARDGSEARRRTPPQDIGNILQNYNDLEMFRRGGERSLPGPSSGLRSAAQLRPGPSVGLRSARGITEEPPTPRISRVYSQMRPVSPADPFEFPTRHNRRRLFEPQPPTDDVYVSALDSLCRAVRSVASHEVRRRLCVWSVCQLCTRQIHEIVGEGTLGEALRSGRSRVDNLLRSEAAIFPRWQSKEAVDLLMEWIMRLAGVLGMLTYFFIKSNYQEKRALAPTIWLAVFQRLSTPLGDDSETMTVLAEDQGVNNFNGPLMTTDPAGDESSMSDTCRVCLDRRPTVALRSCGHVFCRECALRVHRCPVCRKTVFDRLQLFF